MDDPTRRRMDQRRKTAVWGIGAVMEILVKDCLYTYRDSAHVLVGSLGSDVDLVDDAADLPFPPRDGAANTRSSPSSRLSRTASHWSTRFSEALK
jgi:hypothetical protein